MKEAEWLLHLLAVLIGIWLTIRAWRQFRQPVSLTLPGIQAFVWLCHILQSHRPATRDEDLWSNLTFVRLVATAYMGLGALPAWLLVFRLVSL